MAWYPFEQHYSSMGSLGGAAAQRAGLIDLPGPGDLFLELLFAELRASEFRLVFQPDQWKNPQAWPNFVYLLNRNSQRN